jgi:peptidoglycan/LPS O-acetylase OafA/YrhL
MNIAIGMSLASLSSSQGKFTKPSLPRPLPILMIVIGAFLAGFPQDNPETYPWSEWMRKVMFAITPPDADLRRYWDSLGATLIFTGIFYSSTARCILSSRYCNFLGKVSFPVYLLHNQLIKTVLTWLVYGPSWWAGQERDQFGNYLPLGRGGTVWVSFGCGVFFFVLYRFAMWWVHYLDPLIARANKWLVNWAYDVDDGLEKVPNLLG